MTFTHALATNNYGSQKFIVATSAANGTHTTLASALAAASNGDTVYLRDSVTENVTLPAGVNIAALAFSSANVPSITGTVTMTAAGTSSIIGIRFVTNSAAVIVVSGSAASILNLTNCYFNLTNNTGITFSSSSSSARINIFQSYGDVGTTGIAIYSHTSAGILFFYYTTFSNSGASTTASSNSSGTVQISWGVVFSPLSTSSSGILILLDAVCSTVTQNATCITTAGTGTAVLDSTSLSSGTASAISVGSGTTVNINNSSDISSTNTNAITGAGLLQYGSIIIPSGYSGGINTTTQTPSGVIGGGWSSIKTKTASNSATLDFTTLPVYPVYVVVFNNIKPATNAQDLEFLASTDNGGSYVVSGYTSGINFNAYNSTTVTNATATTYGLMARSQSNGVGLYGTVFFTPGNGGWWGQMSFFNTTTATNTLGFITGGSGVVFNALRFQFASGNITSGSISLYGLNQSI